VTVTLALPDPAAPAWSPACMDDRELADWSAMRDRSTSSSERTAIPCADCLLGYAAEMRAIGACNGTPRGAEEDEEPMDLSKTDVPTARDHTPPRRLALDVTSPPCGSCAHEPVCALRTAVEGMASVEIGSAPLPAGLRLALVATVQCDHFLRDRSRPAPERGAVAHRSASTADWTPERRAAQAERMRARNAQKAKGEA
jgi:hypothetical protein